MKFRDDWKWIVPIVAVCVLVFVNSLSGTFVYDDTRQIVRNTLIQDNGLIWKALTSDVWAFKGDGTVSASNYWRPTFTAWDILNFRLFGMNPVGWHVTNVLLHSSICVLIFGLLRRWGYTAMLAFAVAVIFAAHPSHVETVAWISGSPDLLFALPFLGSLWFTQLYAEKRSASNYLILAVILYAVALGAKEIGIICLPIYYFILKGDGTTETAETAKTKKKKSGDLNTPLMAFGSVAVIYFLLRLAVLGALSSPPEDAVGLGQAILSVPSIFVFYLRQAFFPYWISGNYSLTPVSQIGGTNFVLPLAISLAVAAALFYLVKGNLKARLPIALFLLPLIPAMNATVFTPEQIVHDRYLYLSLLGILMLVVPLAAKFIEEKYVLIACVVFAAILSVQTVIFNTAWANETTLWSWNKQYDDSAFTSIQYANTFYEAERYDEAINEFTISINKAPRIRGYLGRARAYLKKQRYQEAERDLKTVLGMSSEKTDAYADYQTYEALGIVYSETRNYPEAIKTFSDARTKLPLYAAALTTNLAIILYQSGQKDAALRELEGAKAQARKEFLPESKAVFLRLGMLYAEQGRKDEARIALRDYLSLTAAISDKSTLASKNQASKLLDTLK